MGKEKCWHTPGRSVNFRSTIFALSSFANCRMSSGVLGMTRASLTCAIVLPALRHAQNCIPSQGKFTKTWAELPVSPILQEPSILHTDKPLGEYLVKGANDLVRCSRLWRFRAYTQECFHVCQICCIKLCLHVRNA